MSLHITDFTLDELIIIIHQLVEQGVIEHTSNRNKTTQSINYIINGHMEINYDGKRENDKESTF